MLADGRVECELCPRACRLREGQRGFCFVRERRGNDIVLTSYGRATGFCVDPIEKKPLYHFYPGSAVLSFGTAGCNLGCKFCQNWASSRARAVDARTEPVSPERVAQAALDTHCRSVAFTYNDPVVFAEFAIDAARACRDRGVATVAVSAGYMNPPAREEFYAVMDAANIDLKAFTPEFYQRFCAARLEPVLETLRYVARETDCWLEVTTLLVPGHNDGPDEVARLAAWCARELGPTVPLHFSAFHPDYRLRDLPRTPAATCARARAIAIREGLDFVYTGNVYDPSGQSTHCPACGAIVIERDAFVLGRFRLQEGRCLGCGAPIAGRLSAAGNGCWGGRRRPVEIPP
ncbi:MAG: AmmeMemoRadiSam system radical SAM enzyme [Polyangiaceae bacterium]|nr:AmmeMemoRadiSam system radical SAM enzyme [Polyangiaceae bacterium]